MTATLCDICGELCGLTVYRVRVAGPAHVHDGDLIVEEDALDVCGRCLAGISDLRSERTRDELVWNERARRAGGRMSEVGGQKEEVGDRTSDGSDGSDLSDGSEVRGGMAWDVATLRSVPVQKEGGI